MKCEKDFSIIYSSCRDYSSLHVGFFKCFNKYFSQFKGNIYSTTPLHIDNFPNINCLQYRFERSFSTRLLKTLSLCDSKYVMLFLDDFYIFDFVDYSFIENALSTMERDNNIGCIILRDCLGCNECCSEQYNDYFGIYDKYKKYRITTQVSLWKKTYLKKILVKGETAWDFEIIGSLRSNHYNELILYRNDNFNNSVQYPKGGVIWNGKFHHSSETDKIMKEFKLQELVINRSNRIISKRLYWIFRKFDYLFSKILIRLPTKKNLNN